jgi:hypothetical protein
MRVIRTQFLALLAAIFVASSAPSLVRTSYLCHMTGRLYTSCCCGSERAREASGAQMKQQGCCTLIRSEHVAAPSTATPLHYVSPAVPAAALRLTTRIVPVADDSCYVPTTPEPHPTGPPKFLAHCTFLI